VITPDVNRPPRPVPPPGEPGSPIRLRRIFRQHASAHNYGTNTVVYTAPTTILRPEAGLKNCRMANAITSGAI
jgi:hypothetical protein